ncbi:MAG TPA: hypothetical protein VIT88_09240 [Pyrinomonadaceae bacterium]
MRLLLLALVLLVTCSGEAAAQPTASGGTLPTGSGATSSPAAKPSKPVKSKTPPAKRIPPNRQPPASVAPIATLDGKWWTTGNGFGDSEVVFTQTGAEVHGVIKWADGRTGTLLGKMTGKRLQHTWTGSNGERGSGWLELSWSNFLGGSWQSQNVRDGSWTLRRIEGKWCFSGSRDRVRTITHDFRGKMLMVTEDGTREEGRLEGPWIYLHGDFGDIRGAIDHKGTRVDWSTGFYWTWCGR